MAKRVDERKSVSTLLAILGNNRNRALKPLLEEIGGILGDGASDHARVHVDPGAHDGGADVLRRELERRHVPPVGCLNHLGVAKQESELSQGIAKHTMARVSLGGMPTRLEPVDERAGGRHLRLRCDQTVTLVNSALKKRAAMSLVSFG